MIYLLHFDVPISDRHTTQHYLGWTDDIDHRVREHRLGRGARLCQVAAERGIGFTLAELLPGSRSTERKLKQLKNYRAFCPICQRKAPGC